MRTEVLNLILISGVSLLNIMLTFYLSNKRVKPEIEKIKADSIESFSDAAIANMQGARISSDLLLERIEEVKRERDEAKQERNNWRIYAYKLRAQVIAAGIDPIPFDMGELKKDT